MGDYLEEDDELLPVDDDALPVPLAAAMSAPAPVPQVPHPMSAMPAPAAAPAPELSGDAILRNYLLKRDSDRSDLLSAQEAANKNSFGTGLSQAAATIGHAISRSSQPMDTAPFQQLQKTADAPVENVVTQMKYGASKDKLLTDYLLRNAGEAGKDRRSVAANQAKLDAAKIIAGGKTLKEKTVSDKQTEKVDDFDAAISGAEDLIATYKPEYTGTLNQLKSNPIAKNFADPETVSYQSKIGRLSDVYRRIVTGAAAADKELARIESRLPQTNDPPEVFQTKAKEYVEAIKQAKERYLNNLNRKGKDVESFRNPNVTTKSTQPVSEKIVGGVKYKKVPGGWQEVGQ